MRCILLTILITLIAASLNAQHLKIMSYNIHHGTNKHEVNTLEAMGRFIKSSGVHLIGLQEVDSVCKRSGNIDQMKVLAKISGMHYAFVRHFSYDGGAYGLGILSKFPIKSVDNYRIKSSSRNSDDKSLALLIATVQVAANKSITFATVHLALDQETRLTQVQQTMTALERSSPVILTGDFNAEPGTKELLNLEEHFYDTDQSQSYTFPEHQPEKKIDYILVDKNHLKKVSKTRVYRKNVLSDHLPLMVKITLAH
jgi:endonuclease/exonuclease/phosphatase family metal-dependent hydrolase